MTSKLARIGWVVAVLAAVIASGFLFLRSDIGQALTGQWSFVDSIYVDNGTYYRLKVKLTYWGTPQDFDIVVGCNVRQINYKAGGNTYEVGLVPTVFGRRMYDGKGLVIRPPSACRGETTASGSVQPDLLPLVVVYENADTLSFGIAYLSEDAYESPLSVLTFAGATIEKATRAEFNRFRREQTNLVTRQIFWTGAAGTDVLKRMGLTPAKEPFAGICNGYQRFRMPEQAKAAASKLWPDAHPDYWITETYEAENAITSPFRNGTHVQTDHDDIPSRQSRQYGLVGDGSADFGFWTRAGGGLVSKSRGYGRPASYYPSTSDYRVDRWPHDRENLSAYIGSREKFVQEDLVFRNGATRGFAYCFHRVLPWVDNTSREPKVDHDILDQLANRRVLAEIDGQLIPTTRPDLHPPIYTPGWIFERDEYAFRFFQLYLGTPRGDV